jgi:hypothetical protein
MNRINLFRTTTFHTAPSALDSVAWGKKNSNTNNFDSTTGTLIFAALLIACSLTVGCSSDQTKSDQTKPVSSNNQSPMTQTTTPITTAPAPATPVQQAAAKPVHKKVARKVSPTVAYVDDAFGVSFQYPRKYTLKTGEAADEFVSLDPVPMDFVQPGGVTLAAVALPESTYPNSNLAFAFFNVSVNKTLSADQCSEFSGQQPNPAPAADPAGNPTTQLAQPPTSKLPVSKLMIGDLELQSSETNVDGGATTGNRDEASKYFHVFQGGSCYEFALKVATTKLDSATTTATTMKPVDRDEVFHRLEQVLATIKINPVTAADVKAEVKPSTQPTPVETPTP